MNYHSSSRKVTRLKFLVKKLGKTKRFSAQFQKLLTKIQSLVNDVKRVVSLQQLAKVLGAAAMFITLSTSNANAQQFAAPVINAFGIGVGSENVVCPTMADLDGDGDLDMMGGNSYGAIQYQRNSGSSTNPIFDAPVDAPFGLMVDTSTYWLFPNLVDIDDDGDFDLFVGEYENAPNSRFAYFENIGTPTSPNFATPVINPFNLTDANYLSTPNLADIDGDGDFDLFSSTSYAVQFYENVGTKTNPNFAAPVTNPNGIFVPVDSYCYNVDVVDMDMDGDLDLIMNEYYGDFFYYQNTGTPTSPNFAAPATNPFSLVATTSQVEEYLTCVESVDIDGDGDIDIIVGKYTDYNDAILYYENLQISTKNENLLSEIALEVFPNPTASWLVVSADLEGEVNSTLFDLSGKALLVETGVFVQSGHKINVDHLPDGNYLLKLETSDGSHISKPFSVIR